MLFSITISNMCRNSAVGKLCGIFVELSKRKLAMALIPVCVSMFVYIDIASVENSLAVLGITILDRSSNTV
jgi:hypothetical protein